VSTGNWSKPDDPNSEITDAVYIYGVVTALVLNAGAYSFLIVALFNVMQEGRRRVLLEIKDAFTVLGPTSKGILMEAFSRPNLWHAKTLTDKDQEELRQTEAKVDASLILIKGVMLLTLIDRFGRPQVDNVFGKKTVDEWLDAARKAHERAAERPHNSLANQWPKPKF